MIYFSDFSVPAAGGHTYWRVAITQNNGDSTYSAIGELEMASTAGGSNLCTGGTPLSGGSGSDTVGRTASSAFNGVATGLWERNATSGTWLGYQFASPVNIAEIRIECSSSRPNGVPKQFTLDYSDDGSSWTTAATYSAYEWDSGWFRTFPAVPGASEHRSWRIFVTSINGGTLMHVSELELRSTAGGADATPTLAANGDGSTAKAIFSGEAAGNEAWRAFDGVISGANGWRNTTTTNQWFGIQLKTAIKVDEITMSGATTTNRGPNTFSLDYSDDGGATWTTQKSWSGITWTSNETKTLSAL